MITSLRRMIEQVIEESPNTITLTRNTMASDGAGGKIRQSSATSVIRCRIYIGSLLVPGIGDIGVIPSGRFLVLCKYSISILEQDRLPYDGKYFRVGVVRNYYYNGSIVAKVAELEEDHPVN